jgi:hypothetical protein
MTRDEAVAEVRKGLGFRPSETSLNDNIVAELKAAQRDLEQGKSLPWFLLQENVSVTLPAGNYTIPLPVGFIREEESQPLRYIEENDRQVRVVRRVLWDAISAYRHAAPGAPKVYVILNTTVYFLPPTDKNYNFFWSYYKTDTVLTTNITNQWLTFAPDLMIGEAGRRIAMKLRDSEAIAVFDSMRKDARVALFAEQVVRDESGGPISLGSAL